MIVATLHESIDLVIGMKNMVELEGILNTRTSLFDFLLHLIPIYPQNDLKVKPGGKAYIKIVAPFQKQINGRAIAKFFTCDKIFTFRMVEFKNRGDKMCELFKDRLIAILGLQSIGYYKVNYQRLIAIAEERFDLFHYTKRLPTNRDENMECYNIMLGTLHRKRGDHAQMQWQPENDVGMCDPDV